MFCIKRVGSKSATVDARVLNADGVGMCLRFEFWVELEEMTKYSRAHVRAAKLAAFPDCNIKSWRTSSHTNVRHCEIRASIRSGEEVNKEEDCEIRVSGQFVIT